MFLYLVSIVALCLTSCFSKRKYIKAEGINEPPKLVFRNSTGNLLLSWGKNVYKQKADLSFEKVLDATKTFFIDNLVYCVVEQELCIYDIELSELSRYTFIDDGWDLSESCFCSPYLYFKISHYCNMKDGNGNSLEYKYYSFDTNTQNMLEILEDENGNIKTTDGHLIGTKTVSYMYRLHPYLFPQRVDFSYAKRTLSFELYNLETCFNDNVSIDMQSNDEFCLFPIKKRIENTLYFVLYTPVFEEGCRISTKDIVNHYVCCGNYSPCLRSIGDVCLYSYNCSTKETKMIKQLPFGSVFLDYDNQTVRYYLDEKFYENGIVVKEINYKHESVEYIGDSFGTVRPNSEDYYVMLYIGYVNNEYVFLKG